jgi:hypothetical protein
MVALSCAISSLPLNLFKLSVRSDSPHAAGYVAFNCVCFSLYIYHEDNQPPQRCASQVRTCIWGSDLARRRRRPLPHVWCGEIALNVPRDRVALLTRSSMSGPTSSLSAEGKRCRWDWCTTTLYSYNDWIDHFLIAHLGPLKSERRRDIAAAIEADQGRSTGASHMLTP